MLSKTCLKRERQHQILEKRQYCLQIKKFTSILLIPFYTAQKMMFSIKDFFSKCYQIRRKLRIWSHVMKKSLMENIVFCEVLVEHLSTNQSKVLLENQIQTDVSRYYILFTRNKNVHKPSTPAFGINALKGVNALNLVLQTLRMFSKSTQPHLLIQSHSKDPQ